MPEIIDNAKVGEFIKQLLKARHMTQDDLANALSISKSAVSQNLNGKSTFDIQNLMQIAKLFEISLDDLLNMKSIVEPSAISGYEKVVQKGLDEIRKVKPGDLRIQEPDLYGKVLIDYVVEYRKIEMFQYLDNADVLFVNDFYHRSKDIYLKVILFMLEEKIPTVGKYILKYASIEGSFTIENETIAAAVWLLINTETNIPLIRELINAKIKVKRKVLGLVSVTNDIKIIAKYDWPTLIGKYRLDIVLKTYLELNPITSDFLWFTQEMIELNYHQGIRIFIDKLFVKPLYEFEKQLFDVQKATICVFRTDDFELARYFMEKGLFSDITGAVCEAIRKDKHEIIEYASAQYADKFDYHRLGLTIVHKDSLPLIKKVSDHLKQDDLDFLFSETPIDKREMLVYLANKGAKVNIKYYNGFTMQKSNALVEYLLTKGVK